MPTPGTGRLAKATFGATTIANVSDITFDWSGALKEQAVMGNNGFPKVVGQGVPSIGGTITGIVDSTDTDGFVRLKRLATVSGTESVSDFRVYDDETNYVTSDTATDANAACYFAGYRERINPEEIVMYDIDFRYSGAVWFTS